MLSVLTPTGARREAFAACVEMMRAQTFAGRVRWIIVDDGPEAMATPQILGWEIVHLRPSEVWRPGQNTQARNLREGIAHCGDRVAIVEDDDAYAPWWLDRVSEWLVGAHLVGECRSLYRHRVTGRERQMGNASHASLCSTAVSGPAVEVLKEICTDGATGIDIKLWRSFRGSKRLYLPVPRGVTGIKGWPGRAGIGIGHRALR